MNKFLRNIVFALIVVSSHSALPSTEDKRNPFKDLQTAAALGSGESFTLTREDLVDLMGEEKANAIFADVENGLKKIEDDRSWNSLKAAIVIGLSVSLWVVYKNFFKKS